MAVTNQPRLTPNAPYRPNNPLLGAILFLSGVKATATDFMFSGHTATFILFAMTVARYTNYGIFSNLFWIFNAFGILSIILTEQHYTVDIFLGFIIAFLTFLVFHLLFDRKFIKWWRPSIDIETDEPLELHAPFTLIDARGKQIVIESKTKKHVIYSAKHFSKVRYHLFKSIDNFVN